MGNVCSLLLPDRNNGPDKYRDYGPTSGAAYGDRRGVQARMNAGGDRRAEAPNRLAVPEHLHAPNGSTPNSGPTATASTTSGPSNNREAVLEERSTAAAAQFGNIHQHAQQQLAQAQQSVAEEVAAAAAAAAAVAAAAAAGGTPQQGGSDGEEDSGEVAEPIHSWTRGKLIGAGAFGKVYVAMNNMNGEMIAVKQVGLTREEALRGRVAEHTRALEAEVHVLRHLRHENIVQYLGTERTDDCLNIFLEYVSGGSIASLIEKFGPLQETVVRIYTRQILRGLEYLHRKKIMHRDIKGANILVDKKGCVKLADFGASKTIEDLATMGSGAKSIRGTPYWMAPEVIKQTGHGRPADIWSLGCVVIEMATGKPPWSNCHTQVAAMFHIASTREPPPLPASLSAEAKDFLLLCFNRVPTERPNATRLLKHPFVANLPAPAVAAAATAAAAVAATAAAAAPKPPPPASTAATAAGEPGVTLFPFAKAAAHAARRAGGPAAASPLPSRLAGQAAAPQAPSPIKEEGGGSNSARSSPMSVTQVRQQRTQPPAWSPAGVQFGATKPPSAPSPLAAGNNQSLSAHQRSSSAASIAEPPPQYGAAASRASSPPPPPLAAAAAGGGGLVSVPADSRFDEAPKGCGLTTTGRLQPSSSSPEPLHSLATVSATALDARGAPAAAADQSKGRRSTDGASVVAVGAALGLGSAAQGASLHARAAAAPHQLPTAPPAGVPGSGGGAASSAAAVPQPVQQYAPQAASSTQPAAAPEAFPVPSAAVQLPDMSGSCVLPASASSSAVPPPVPPPVPPALMLPDEGSDGVLLSMEQLAAFVPPSPPPCPASPPPTVRMSMMTLLDYPNPMEEPSWLPSKQLPYGFFNRPLEAIRASSGEDEEEVDGAAAGGGDDIAREDVSRSGGTRGGTGGAGAGGLPPRGGGGVGVSPRAGGRDQYVEPLSPASAAMAMSLARYCGGTSNVPLSPASAAMAASLARYDVGGVAAPPLFERRDDVPEQDQPAPLRTFVSTNMSASSVAEEADSHTPTAVTAAAGRDAAMGAFEPEPSSAPRVGGGASRSSGVKAAAGMLTSAGGTPGKRAVDPAARESKMQRWRDELLSELEHKRQEQKASRASASGGRGAGSGQRASQARPPGV